MYPLDFAILIWGVIGVQRLYRLLRLRADGQCLPSAVISTAVVFTLVPLVIIRINLFEYSAVGIIAVCVEIFWFVVLASRSGNVA